MKIFGAMCLLAGLASCSMEPPTGPIAGKAYFTQVGCAACHRVGGEGGGVGPDLTLVGFRHSSQWLERWLENPEAWKPGTLMPNKRLSATARGAIVSYLVTLKGQDWPGETRPWNAAKDILGKGRLIYLRAGCVACHGQGGVGGYPNNNVMGGKIPALSKARETFTKLELISKIKRGVAHPLKAEAGGPDPLLWMPAWKEVLTDEEIDAVATYLLSLMPADAQKADW